MTIEFRIKGLEGLWLLMAKMTHRYNRGYRRGVRLAAEMILKESRKIVPVKTGFLRDSGYVEVTGEGFRSKADVGYSAHYAIYQHENLTYRHRPGQQAKYLSSVILRRGMQKRILKIIFDEMKK